MHLPLAPADANAVAGESGRRTLATESVLSSSNLAQSYSGWTGSVFKVGGKIVVLKILPAKRTARLANRASGATLAARRCRPKILLSAPFHAGNE